MRIMHVEARRKVKQPSLKEVRKIRGKIGLVTTVQYAHLIPGIRKELPNSVATKTLAHDGQVLGCNVSAALMIKDEVDSFLFIGEGEFHPMKIALETRKPVHVLQMNGKLRKVKQEDVNKWEKKKWARISKAKRAKTFGIIVSVKPGQEKMRQALELQKSLGKAYIFVCDTIPFNDLENFQDVDCWINTACPRLTDDHEKFPKTVINVEDAKWLTQ